jgi:hypothetical protein
VAREEHDREDLLAEAAALVERAEWRDRTTGEVVVAGWRAGGAASFYFGPDAVYHFNGQSELRRAYVDGLLYKAERGRLVSLRRVRTRDEVQLVRQELSVEEQAQFLGAASQRLDWLARRLAEHGLERTRQVSPSGQVEEQLQAWLDEHAAPPQVAASPGVV